MEFDPSLCAAGDLAAPGNPAGFGTGPWRAMAWETVAEAFDRQAAALPDATAVRCGARSLTYAALRAASDHLARRLRQRGIRRGDRVAILLGRRIEAVVAVLGVMKAGATYVPVDTSYPDARITFIIEDSAARLVLTASEHLARLPAGIDRLALDAPAEMLDDDEAPSPAGPDDAIYVIYTSGSTGRPKGAAVTHRSFANLLQWYVHALSLDARDAFLLVSALGFDLTQKNLYAPLLVGGTLHMPDSDVFDPAMLVATIEAAAITVVNCTPSTFLPLAEGPAAGRPERLASLRWVVLGGEPIPIRRLLPWLRHPSCRARILNTYGPTECTDICAAWAVDGQRWEDPVPIGRPIDNVFLAVLDEHRRPVEAEQEGELWIGGAGVGLGYLGRPDLNAERFVPLSLPGHSGPMYRTGDQVKWRADSTLAFFGRLDHQTKIRGHRVELGEIEAALCEHAAIREACSLVRQQEAQEARLVAYLVAHPGQDAPSDAALRAHLARFLPEHMLPSDVVWLDAMPLSPNGKIDRHALPAPAAAPPAVSAAPAAPGVGRPGTLREMEALVAGIWQATLQRPPTGSEQNFFDAGGTSLSLASVQAQIMQRLGVDVPIVALFANPTIASLARHLSGEDQARPVPRSIGRNQVEALRRLNIARRVRP